MSWREHNGCRGKKRYFDQATAESARDVWLRGQHKRKKLNLAGGMLTLNAYKCPRCPWWHVGRALRHG